MFDWIPFDSVLFWIWLVGFALLSIPVFFAWILNSAFLGDSTDKWYRRRMFALYTLVGFVMTWLWPVGIVGMGCISLYKKNKQRKWDKVWKHKKATVPNYWKNYHLIIDGKVTDIQVRVLDWDFYNGNARLAIWRGDSRFWCDGKEIIVYWPNKDLEPIPEKLEKV
jgi:4-amino-4-deoxy-L-arabinose transferase-like glycosyltransferase